MPEEGDPYPDPGDTIPEDPVGGPGIDTHPEDPVGDDDDE